MAQPLPHISRYLIKLIHGYQVIISRFLGPHCRFQPTCSDYMITSIRRFGIFRGSALAIKRVLKCHPLNQGGEDFVPPKMLKNREN